ncbi:hypothetical protein B5M09_006060 [Aphanomyces astaci]|nr:hypothetical protein B5M09_006060 [Aphanomyces astaci]
MQTRRPPLCVDNACDQRLVLDAEATTAGLHLRNVARCDIECVGRRVAQITMENCEDVRVVFVSVVAAVDVMRCCRVQLTYTGTCGTITIDGSSHIAVHIPAATVHSTWVVCTRVSHLSVLTHNHEHNDKGDVSSPSAVCSHRLESTPDTLELESVDEGSTITWQDSAFICTRVQRQTLFAL